MIGTLARKDLAPLEYRYALNAAMPMLAGKESRKESRKESPLVRCHVPELRYEVWQRLPYHDHLMERHPASLVSRALWVEPRRSTWRKELAELASRLSDEGLLVIVASRPLARVLPERKGWKGEPLGVRLGGLYQLCRGLQQAGFVLERNDGIHSLEAIVINQVGSLVTRLGFLALGDRLEFAARLCYRATGVFAPCSTVALLVARKES